MKKQIYTPIIGSGEQDVPVKNSVGIDSSMTWATKKTASEYGVGQAWFSDLNAIFYSNGSEWKPISEIVLKDITKGYIVPSLAAANAATYSQSGTTLTITSTAHGLSSNLNGSDIYLVIGGVSLGVAPVAPTYGNWFTNFTYVDANTFTCTASNSQTGSGAVNTNTADTNILELSATIPGGLLGNECKNIETIAEISASTVAGNKALRLRLDGTTYHEPIIATTSLSYRTFGALRAVSASLQRYVSALYTGFGGSTGLPSALTKDTSIDTVHSVSIHVTTESQFIAILAIRTVLK